jgi:hypothetical protein
VHNSAQKLILVINVRLVGGWEVFGQRLGHDNLTRAVASCEGSVLDVEMTMLDKQSKGIPIDEQANDDVVHLDRFREADRLADQAFDPCA